MFRKIHAEGWEHISGRYTIERTDSFRSRGYSIIRHHDGGGFDVIASWGWNATNGQLPPFSHLEDAKAHVVELVNSEQG